MKINIVYTKNTDVDAPCCAKTEVMGQDLLAIGKTWEEAKARLVTKVTGWLNANAPAPETVNVPVAGEEEELFNWEKQAEQMAGAMDTMMAKMTGTRDIEAGKL